MSKPLPPLNTFRVFEAAARHLSFTQAAAELGMTQAAVSYQIKLLEDRLGTSLFRRLTRQLALTDAGQKLSPVVTETFQRLRTAISDLTEGAEGVLSISSINTFATNWLVPRLGRFQVAQPKIAVRLEASPRLVDFAREDFDVGIRGGAGRWPGLVAVPLMTVELSPMVAPSLLAKVGGVTRPRDLLQLPLLAPDEENWERWFDAAGEPVQLQPQGPFSTFETQHMLGQAAMSGQGVALLTLGMFGDELDQGRLVQPFATSVRLEQSYFLVYPETRANTPKIRAFEDWILTELMQDRARRAA
ncbi:MAG: LysR family transcriptional regulator [Rhodospirillales bacterium]|nr:LysR family transcriptional regulator [Rhodospirillales bacterium]